MSDKKNLKPRKPTVKLRGTPVPLTPKPAPLGLAPKIKPRQLGVAPKGSSRKPATPAVPQKPAVKRPNAKPVPMPKKTLRGPDAIKEYQRQVSPKGIKKTESSAKKAIDKKYPGLYKK